MLFEIKNGTLSQGGNEILSHFNFRMVDNEKIGIVGRNGAGKTTLLKLVMDELKLDYNDDNTIGEIIKSKNFNCGYLKQQLAGSDDNLVINDMTNIKLTAYNYLLEAYNNLIEMEQKIQRLTDILAENYDEKKVMELNSLIDLYNVNGGETYIKELKTGFNKFGFSEIELEKLIGEFSGGQATKISLLKLLLLKPDVLVLDEPTNHLDIDAIEWMENYLKNYKKNVVIVSHDRMFLDNICNVIYDVENKITTRYEGNYTDFVEQKQINYQLQLAEYNKNLKEIERLTKLADRFRYKSSKAKMVQSKDKIIERIEEKNVKPLEADTKTFSFEILPNKVGGKEVFSCSDLVIGYEKPLVNISNFIVYRGDRIAVIGANGTGKSTFIKTIVGVINKISGEYNYGHEIEYEYFDQKIAENSSKKTLFDDFSDEFPNYDNTTVRNRLGRFLFSEDDISKRVCDLSGGEKVRLCLSKIFERRPNLLVLDEPTNHLDIMGKESLEKIIQNFTGTVIFVSHDRYFVKKISNKILLFEKGKNGFNSTKFFEFGYDDYENYVNNINYINNVNNANKINNEYDVNKKEIIKNKKNDIFDLNSIFTKNNKKEYKECKEKNKNEKKVKKIEQEIAKIEENIKILEQKMNKSDIQCNFEELTKIQNEIDENKITLNNKYMEWEALLAVE